MELGFPLRFGPYCPPPLGTAAGSWAEAFAAAYGTANRTVTLTIYSSYRASGCSVLMQESDAMNNWLYSYTFICQNQVIINLNTEKTISLTLLFDMVLLI